LQDHNGLGHVRLCADRVTNVEARGDGGAKQQLAREMSAHVVVSLGDRFVRQAAVALQQAYGRRADRGNRSGRMDKSVASRRLGLER
jgi:hypothetical protein